MSKKPDGSRKFTAVLRGTERARRRDGISAGWRSNSGAKQMQPAKAPPEVFVSTHSVSWSPETLKTLAMAKSAAEKFSTKAVAAKPARRVAKVAV